MIATPQPLMFEIQLLCTRCVRTSSVYQFIFYDEDRQCFLPQSITVGCKKCRRTIFTYLEVYGVSDFTDGVLGVLYTKK